MNPTGSLLSSGGLLFMVIGIALFALSLFALIDAATRPSVVWQGTVNWPKPAWLAILAVAALVSGLGFFGLIGLVATIYYLVDVRPKLREAQGPRGRGW